MIEEPEVNKVYQGKVKRIADFGAFVEIIPNTDGLLHVSEIAHHRVERVEDELRLGEYDRGQSSRRRTGRKDSSVEKGALAASGRHGTGTRASQP